MDESSIDILLDSLFVFSKNWGKFMHSIANEVENEVPRIYIGILMNLRKNGQLPISRIAEKTSIAKPNMTLLIDGLVGKGWVTRCTSNIDRRIINIELTEDGEKYLQDIYAKMRLVLKEKLSAFSDDEISKIIGSINTLIEISKKLIN